MDMRNSCERTAAVELRIAEALRRKKKTLAIAESCTGGLISHRITNVPGSSVYFKGGVVAYSDWAKESILAVSSETIRSHGAVSRQVARSMAEGARRVLNADVAVSVTGIAGPGGGSSKKPVGLAYMALVSGKAGKTRKMMFKGNRLSIKTHLSQVVLEFILGNI